MQQVLKPPQVLNAYSYLEYRCPAVCRIKKKQKQKQLFLWKSVKNAVNYAGA